MLEIGILVIASLLFLVSMGALITMVIEFSHMKTAAILMESAFKEHAEMVDGMQNFVRQGLESTEQQFTKVMEEYVQVMSSNNSLQERINELEKSVKKPMSPDVTLN